MQNGLSLVQTFHEVGVRWMLIAYNRNNAAGGGCLDADCGLTAVGRAIIDAMERVGMVLCLSHPGARTAVEALEYWRTPHARNISDELMHAYARVIHRVEELLQIKVHYPAKDGMIGLGGIGPLLVGWNL